MEGFHSENRCQGSPLTDSVAIKEEIDIKDEPEFVIVQSPITEFHEIEKEDHLNYSQSVERESETINSEDYDIACGPCKPEIVKLEPCESVLFVSCEVCKKLFSTETDLREHQNDSVDCIALVDEECKPETISPQGEDMKSAFSLENVTDTETLIYGEATENEDNKQDGSDQDTSSSSSNQFRCEVCQKSFQYEFRLLDHKVVHEYDKPFRCKTCPASFKRNSDKTKHEKKHEIEPFLCTFCWKSFPQETGLDSHMKVHDSKSNRFQCNICKKCYPYESYLVKHQAVHMKDRPYHCETCKKEFKRKRSLERHEKLHVKVKLFQCKFCSKSFDLIPQLRTHIKTHEEVPS